MTYKKRINRPQDAKQATDSNSPSISDSQMARLERLVDELVKQSPREDVVRERMEAAGLAYSADSIVRMNNVLAAIDIVRGRARDTEREV